MEFRINTDILYGNACDTSMSERDGIPEVSFAPDPHGGPECLWFCFRLERIAPTNSQKVKLVLKHSYNMLGGGAPLNMRPVIRYGGNDWERLNAPDVEKLPDGRNLVSWLINTPEIYADIAYCYPYGRDEIETLIKETGGYWHKDIIGVSQNARSLIRLSNTYGSTDKDRPGLYLASRQHSSETSGSWVLDGFLRYIASLGDNAPIVWSIPLTNIDGVEQGDYGKDNFPYDLNRAWGSPPMRHEVLVYQRDMQRWKERCRPVLGIDFHSPGACESDGIYCFLPNPDKYPEHHQNVLKFANAAEEALKNKYAAPKFGRVATYSSRWETPTFATYCWLAHRISGFTFETPYAIIGDTVMTRERYQEAGKLIASAVINKL